MSDLPLAMVHGPPESGSPGERCSSGERACPCELGPRLPRQEILSCWNSQTLLTTPFIYLFASLKYFLGICYVLGSALGGEEK